MADAVQTYHERTKHTPRSVLEGGRLLDWDNQPLPLKIYPTLDPLPLPGAWDEPPVAMAAALSGEPAQQEREVRLDRLARLLFLSAGITRREGRGERTMLFRAAPSAGALYPVELYVVCGDLPDLAAGLYHFEPAEFALRRLRDADVRGHLASAAADPSISSRPLSLVVTGIPWRTTWKYGARGYRHLFWDAGTILANTLVAAHSDGLVARVLAGFVDHEVSRLLGIDTTSHPFDEHPLAIVTLGAELPDGPAQRSAAELLPVEEQVVPLSAQVREEPDLRPAHDAGVLGSTEEVRTWREGLTGLPQRPAVRPVRPPDAPALTVEEVVLRRGSTRRFSRDAVPERLLTWGMAAASAALPADFAGEEATLLSHFLCVHAVENVAPGAYAWEGGQLELLRPGDFREETARLCLDQPLGGDAAFTVFHCSRLDTVVSRGGARSYRAAQLEAGIAAGRLQLAAFTLDCGGSGLTFYDDEVRAFFDTPAQPMTTTAIGVPAYEARPGRLPSELPPIRLQR